MKTLATEAVIAAHGYKTLTIYQSSRKHLFMNICSSINIIILYILLTPILFIKLCFDFLHFFHVKHFSQDFGDKVYLTKQSISEY